MLVVPNADYGHAYDLPPELATPIQRVTREVALAFKETYRCDGVSTRQHNEPAGMQDVWHYHQNVLPRSEGDNLYLHRRRVSTPEERRPYVAKLREFLARRDATR